MKAYLWIGALSLALTCGLAAIADTEPGPAATDDVQDIVFFSATRPVLLRLHLRLDGKSYQAAWEEFLHYLMGYLDKDKDGILSREEAERTPPVQVLFNNNLFSTVPQLFLTATTFDKPQANRDGQVTIEELRHYYRRSGVPFQIQVRPAQARAPVQPAGLRTVGPSPTPNADVLNEALFKLLDTNQDGKLSREELAAAPTVLLQRDTDDDEMIMAQEVTPGPDPFGPRPVPVPPTVASSRGPDPTFWALSPGEPPSNLVRQLLTRYGGKGARPAQKLTRQSCGLDEATFSQLDVDGDGELDSEELAGFVRRPPDLELTVDLSGAIQPRPGSQATSRVVGAPSARLGGGEGSPLRPDSRPTPLSSSLRSLKEGGLVLDLGTTALDLRVSGSPRFLSSPGQDQQVRDAYKRQFAAADRDNNGYLDQNEVRSTPLFQALFKLMDLDGDGKLYEKEMLAYLDQLQDLRARMVAGCASLNVVDQGRGLFDLLDSNGDGQLGVREMRNTVQLLARLDRNGDGFLSKDEIPHSYLATFVRGPVDTTALPPRVVVASGPARPPVSGTSSVRGPLWFRKMDRNQDGDVSHREFVGTVEQFAQIDTDGDGLISAEEAERADAGFREQRDSRR